MYGFKPGSKPKDKDKGGKIEGPGTGTSDSIKTEIPKGSYIMPADSTQQIGPKALGELGEPVPVNVSNGEYQMPPEQVHAVGVQALNQMRDATHMPAPAGFTPQNDGLYFDDGGSPAEEERKRLAGAGPSPQMGAVALGNERRAERMSGEGMYGKANADVGGALNYLNRGDPVKDAASAVGGFFARSSDQARMADYGNTGTPSPIAATPAAVPTPPAAVGATELPSTKGRTDYGFTPDPGQGQAPGMSVRPTSAEGINRIDNAPGLKSPLFTNLPTGEAISGMQGGTVNTVPALKAPAATQQAPQPAGFHPYQQQSPAGGVIGNSDASRRERDALIRAASTPHRGAQSGQLTANQLRTLAGLQEGDQRAATEAANQQAATERAAMQEAGANARALSRDEIDRRSADTESLLKGFEARGMERIEKLYAAYESAKTPEERAAVAEQIRALSGKEAPNRFTVVPGGQEFDPTANMVLNRPAMVLNNQTGQPVNLGGAQASRAAMPPPNHIDALKKNPNQAAQFDAIYGEGAAARYLGAN
jgi:hypothetical protein